uniref:Endoglucanase n=1 Tax=Heterodera avenae TaxID=34510 RepID=D5FQ93_HETAV|nr:beta-1,4-endoglucanase [Heterodera avenae]AFQ55438.1 beta-1,4-endoglucanase 1a [Heterodera avenae]
MCRLRSMFIHLCLLLALCIALANSLTAVPPPYGQLSVSGTKLVGSNGQQVQLIGNSLFWHQWYGNYWNAETVKALKCQWNANVVRGAMGADSGGYVQDPGTAYKLMSAVIEAAISNGIYVIVDWHAHDPFQDKAIEFFTKIAKTYGSYPHILYETYNEPVGVSWNDVLVSYHTKVVGAIRAIDQKNVIILGTPMYSQDVDIASQNPIKGYKNLMYTFHFYASSHFVDGLGAKVRTAINNGLPIFVTEYGTCEASGAGSLNSGSMNSWWKMLDELKISYVNWSICDKGEACSALKPGSSSANVASPSSWTESGNMVASHHKTKPTGVSCNGAPAPSAGGAPSPAQPSPPSAQPAPPPAQPVPGPSGSASASINVLSVSSWNGGGQLNIEVKNTGSAPLCGVQFRLNLPQGTTIGNAWNADPAGQGQYKLPSWIRIEPGQDSKQAGMTYNGNGKPTAQIVSTKPC